MEPLLQPQRLSVRCGKINAWLLSEHLDPLQCPWIGVSLQVQHVRNVIKVITKWTWCVTRHKGIRNVHFKYIYHWQLCATDSQSLKHKVSSILDRGCQLPLRCSYKRLMSLNLRGLPMIPKHTVTYSETIKGSVLESPLTDRDCWILRSTVFCCSTCFNHKCTHCSLIIWI